MSNVAEDVTKGIIKSINWSVVWEKLKELFNIPTWLKVLLGTVLIFGLCYVFYLQFFLGGGIRSLQKDVLDLTNKVEQTVDNNAYKDDLVCLISAIKILENENSYYFMEVQTQLNIMKKFIQRTHPNDPILTDIDVLLDRNEFEYNTTTLQYKNCIEQCTDKLVRDSLHLSRK